jgi:hypothetical protein
VRIATAALIAGKATSTGGLAARIFNKTNLSEECRD